MAILYLAGIVFVLAFISAKFMYKENFWVSIFFALFYVGALLFVSFVIYAWPH